METFEINGPDGVYEVRAPDAQSAAAAFKQMQGTPAPQGMAPADMTAAQSTPLNQLGGLDVDQLQHVLRTAGAQSRKDITPDTMVRQTAKGVPFIGQYLDEANAATNAAFNPLLGSGLPGATYGERYNANVGQERATDRKFETENPVASTALQVGGGVASGAGLLRAAPAVGNFAFGNLGSSFLPRALGFTASGAVQGATGGFGAGETMPERQAGAITGGGVGALVGGIAGSAIHGGTSALNWLRSRIAATQAGANMGLPERPSVGAVQRVARNVEADNLTPAGAQDRAAELGPAGMVMDYGRQLGGRAEAVATMPGSAQNTVLDATENRIRGTAARVGAELDRELGPTPDIVQTANHIDRVYNAHIRPLYEKVMADHPDVWSQRLETLTKRPSIARAIEDAVPLANEMGSMITSPFIRTADGQLVRNSNVTPNLAFWDYVKKSLDSRINAFARNPDIDSAGKTSMAALLDTKRALTDSLDQITNGAYANARSAAADKFAVREALENGLGIFKNSMLPEQFQETLTGMGHIERAAMAAGARRALERMREVAPSSMTEGGRAVYRELLQGGTEGDTAQKLRMLLGDDAAERLIGAAQRETGFQSIHDRIASNSRTAVRGQLIGDMQTPTVPELSLTAAVNRVPLMPVERGFQSMLTNNSERTRQGIANILTAQGRNADPVIDALLQYVNRRQLAAPSGAVAAGMPAAVEQARQGFGQ